MAILLFIFFLIVFILMLVGGNILKKLKDAKKAVEEAADLREQRLRNETGRQRQQYSQRAQGSQNTQSTQNSQNTQNNQNTQGYQNAEYENARRTETATGATVIDHHHQNRENKQICDDEAGEYVEFEEA